MKINTGLILAVCFFAATFCFAQDPQMGTWKLKESKSKFAPGMTKNHTVVYERMETTALNAPDGRVEHTAVWAGNEMIVWGGTDFIGFVNNGGRYCTQFGAPRATPTPRPRPTPAPRP
jgi:hypothetical protein